MLMCCRMLHSLYFSCFVIKFLHFWDFHNPRFGTTICSRQGGFFLPYMHSLILRGLCRNKPSSSIQSGEKSSWCL